MVPGYKATVFFADSIASAGLLSPRTVLIVVLVIALGAGAGSARRLMARQSAATASRSE